jgi:tetratricopeptide (TPR) repeat protein/transglutaminase-like putative cysteine protease
MYRVVLALALGLGATVAHAGDKPVIAPPAGWVRPAEPAKASAAAAGDTAAVHVLLLDQQIRFGPQGETAYAETRMRIQTAQGLSAMGTVVLPWKPDTGDITIHKVQILRGDQVIDVLAGQTFTVLRRENNLELAMLDGVLTATLQPEGLQVGDILDIAYSVEVDDPVLQGRAEATFGALPNLPVDRVRIRAVWPSARPVQVRLSEGLPQVRPVRAGDTTELALDLRDLQPAPPPAGAPARFQTGRQVEISEFAAWADVSALLAPLYATASTLKPNSPLKAEAAKIRAASSDPKVQAALALDLVQDKVRYVFLGMNDGGLAPAAADTTWSRRFGDCKGKTVLLLALLKELGIEAQPSLIATRRGDGLEARLPTVAVFDHVLVRLHLGGRDYWLDGTRTGDGSLEAIRTPPFHWTLPVQPAGAGLVRLTQVPLERAQTDISLRIDASAGLDSPAPVHGEAVLRGDEGLGTNLKISNLVATERDRALQAFWRKLYDFVEVKTATASFDPRTGEETLVMDGTANVPWRPSAEGRRFEISAAEMGWNPDFKREPGPHADAPFAVAFPFASRNVSTVVLPRGGEGFTILGPDLDLKAAGFVLKRTSRIEKGVFTAEASVRSLVPEFPAAEAPAAGAALKEASKVGVFLRAPPNWRPTEKDTASALAAEPKTAQDFVTRGAKLIETRAYDKAIADLDQAIRLDPKLASAYANRGVARYWKGETGPAKADFDTASALDSRSFVAQHGYGMLAEREGRAADAIAAFTRAADLRADNVFALSHRAMTYWSIGEADKALADSAEALRLNPGAPELRFLRADIFHARKDDGKALAEVDLAIAAHPDIPELAIGKADLLARYGRAADSAKLFATAIAAKPTAEAYLTRAADRDRADWAGRLSDIEAALKLDPKSVEALVMRAAVQVDAGDPGRAVAGLTQALPQDRPDQPLLLFARAEAYARSGQAALATRDYAQIRARAAGNPALLNNLCWSQATAGFAYDLALADCEASLKIAPANPGVLDSRAFVLLRLGRHEAAIAGYDQALALRPREAASLFGRGLARLGSGHAAEGRADLDAARAIDARIDGQFAGYGLRP